MSNLYPSTRSSNKVTLPGGKSVWHTYLPGNTYRLSFESKNLGSFITLIKLVFSDIFLHGVKKSIEVHGFSPQFLKNHLGKLGVNLSEEAQEYLFTHENYLRPDYSVGFRFQLLRLSFLLRVIWAGVQDIFTK